MKSVILVVACALLGVVPARAQVVLNEIMPDPARDWDGDSVYNYRDDEWVEILNHGGEPVQLEGYRIATADTAWRYELSGSLAPAEHLVVFGSESYAWEKMNGYPAFGFRMNNSGGRVQLWKLGDQDTVLVDEVEYTDSQATDDCSYGRHPSGGVDWEVFDGLDPMGSGGNGCNPSPGASNDCDSALRAVTWGRIKMIYGDR